MAALILLFCDQQEINKTKLNKLLFFTDLLSFRKHRATITKTNYFKMQYGPVPEYVDIVKSVLEKRGSLISTAYTWGGGVSYEYRTAQINRSKVEGALTPEQLECQVEINRVFSNLSAATLSDFSHDIEPWKSADWYEALNFDIIREASNEVEIDAFFNKHGIKYS